MADIALGSVEKIVRAGLAIKRAVETVRQNEQGCQEIGELVATLMAVLPLLQQTAVMNHPAMHRALVGLERTLNRAHKLVTDCQAERNIASRILGSRDMSRKLRRVQDDILLKTVLGTFATTVQVTMTVTNTIPYAGAHPPLLTQQQNAGEVKNSCINHLTTDGPRSRVNSNIMMAATRSNVRYAPSSNKKIIGGGGLPGVSELETITMAQMTSEKNEYKVMKLVSVITLHRVVDSLSLFGYICDYHAKDQVVVVINGVYSLKPTSAVLPVHKEVALADMLVFKDIADWDGQHPPVPAYGIIFIFLFLLFLRIVVALSHIGYF